MERNKVADSFFHKFKGEQNSGVAPLIIWRNGSSVSAGCAEFLVHRQ